jgi:hypothetical protein
VLDINIIPGEGAFADIGWEPVSGFEPLTCRLQGAIGPSWIVAGRRLTSHLPAPIVARRRPMSVTACMRWLPLWLPASGVTAVSGLRISGFAARYENDQLPIKRWGGERTRLAQQAVYQLA